MKSNWLETLVYWDTEDKYWKRLSELMKDYSESPEGSAEIGLTNDIKRRYMEAMKKRRKS